MELLYFCTFKQLPEQQLPSLNFGWTKQNNIWVPKWTTQSGIAEYCQELQKCGCIKLQFTGNATVQAFHAQKCVHVAVKKTNKSYSCEQLSY